MVVGWTNTNLEAMAREYNVKVKVYCPDWLGAIVQNMHNYWTQDYRTQRDNVLQQRQNLGLE